MEGIINIFWSIVGFILSANFLIWALLLLAIFGWNFLTGLIFVLSLFDLFGLTDER